jgi:tetratricopeptide (TPR) repeat protein
VRRTGARFELHPLVRAFARERLAELPEAAQEVRTWHAEHSAAYLAEHAGAVGRAAVHAFLRDVSFELDNIRAAWSWALSVGRNDLVADMLPLLDRYHATRGLHQEHLKMVEEALERVDRGPLWSSLEQGRMRSLLAMKRYTEVRRRGVEDLEVHRRVGRPADVVNVLNLLAAAIAHLGDIGEAQGRWREALALAETSGADRSAGASHANLAVTSSDVDGAEHHGRAAISCARRSGNLLELVQRLRNHALHVMHSHGRYAEAADVAAEAVEVARRDLGEDGLLASTLSTQCHVERARGSLEAAAAAVDELEILLTGDVPPESVEALRREPAHHRACLLLARGEPSAGLALARATLLGSPSPADHALLARLALADGDLGEAAASNAVARQRAAAGASIRDGLRETIAADLLDAELELASRSRARAGRHLLRALRQAHERHFVPSLFDVFVTAAALLGGERRAVLLDVASSDWRASWETRLRARTLRGGDPPALGTLGAGPLDALAGDVREWVERAASGADDIVASR